nr:fumarylacetoacetate hydrolase family protein [Saccharopolyspora erythraea]
MPASAFAYEGTPVDRERFIAPFVELEPAFILKRPLRGPNITVADVINAIEYAVPAIEIIDSRVQNWAIELPDTLSDNGSTGAVILGGTPRRVDELTLSDTRGTLHFNGHHMMDGNTRNILRNPFAATAWLCNRLATYGVEFEPGQVILPGSCLEAVPMNEAGHWSGTFAGWGAVEFEVSAP